MKNYKDHSKGINRKSFKRTGRKGTSKGIRHKGTSNDPKNKGPRRKGMRRKNTRLKNYSKRKNLKKSTTKMKGGAAMDMMFARSRFPSPKIKRIRFDGNVTLREGEKNLITPRGGTSYPAEQSMEISGTGELVGSGAFGQVRQFTMTKSGEKTPVAIKIMEITSNESLQTFEDEHKYLKKLSSENNQYQRYFVKVYNFFYGWGNFCGIVMDFIEPKFRKRLNLFKLIELKELSENQQVRYSLELARAISATHKMSIVHGDLKPENVVIADGGGMGQLKLVDFGMSFMAGDEKGQNKIDCCIEGLTGTLEFNSYEIQEKEFIKTSKGNAKHGAASDWWSYGVMVFEIATGMGKLSPNHHPCLFVDEKGVVDSIIPIYNGENMYQNWKRYLRVWSGMKATQEGGKEGEMDIDEYWKKYTRKHSIEYILNTEVRLLLQLAFQFFVEDPKERPFLCLDEPQMEAYDGTREGVRAEALQKIVAELEELEAEIIESSL